MYGRTRRSAEKRIGDRHGISGSFPRRVIYGTSLVARRHLGLRSAGMSEVTAPVFNPFETGFFDDPYDQYARLRELDPVHQSPLGIWALFRYDDVLPLLRDPHASVEEQYAV